MNIFFIDYENVHNNGFIGLDKLKKKDKMYIFYSVVSENISIDVVNSLLSKGTKFKTFKLYGIGKNALDFQLVLYLGVCLRKYGDSANYYIISKDNGYQSAIDFAKDNFNIIVRRAEDIKEAFNNPQPRLLLLENNPTPKPKKEKSPIENNPTPKSKKEKRLEIEEKLSANSTLRKKLMSTQYKQISALLVDETKNNMSDVTKALDKLLGQKKKKLVPIVLTTCRKYIK